MRIWAARHGETLWFVAVLAVILAVLFSFDYEDARYTPLILMVGAFGLMLFRDPLVAVTAAVPYGVLYAVILVLPASAAGMLSIVAYVFGLYFLIAPDGAAERWSRLVLRRKPESPGRHRESVR